jgi:pimeloyl-ACP methyl ester carboxylesterase
VTNADAHEGGAGPTLVLLHGLGGTWHIWKPVLALLESSHRVVALTLPGHAGGPPLPEGTGPSIEVIADTLEAELDRRGITQAHFAGNSLGGWLSLEMQRRGRAQSVTALSPAGAWRTPEDYAAVSKSFRIVFALLPLLIVLLGWLMHFAWVRRVANAKAMRRADRMTADDARQAMKSMRQTRMLPSLLDNMGRTGPIRPFNVPPHTTRIAWGDDDQVIPYPRYGAPMVESVRGCEQLTVNGVGHVPMYDDPEQVARVIAETVARAPASAAEHAA